MFWVYENEPASKAKIHLGICPWCRNGLGTDKPKEIGIRDAWHGSFENYEQALDCAESTSRPVSSCGHCVPKRFRVPDASLGANFRRITYARVCRYRRARIGCFDPEPEPEDELKPGKKRY